MDDFTLLTFGARGLPDQLVDDLRLSVDWLRAQGFVHSLDKRCWYLD